MFQHEERMDPDRYYTDHYATFSQYLGRYVWASRFAGPQATVLDLGCGCGYGAAYLAEAPGRTVIGIDQAPEGTGYAKKRYASNRLAFVTASATELPVRTDSVDLVVAMEMIEHVADDKGLVGEVKRALRPNGVFVVSTPNRKVTGSGETPKNPFHVREYTTEEFRGLLRLTFQEVFLYGHQLTPALRICQENMDRIWHNLSLIPRLYDQVHALRARLEMDERFTGLSLLRKLKRRFFGQQGPSPNAMEDLHQAFRHAQFPLTGMMDWEISPYEIEGAPVILAVCRK